MLPLTKAPDHPHLAARGTFVTADGLVQPGPAPRSGRTRSGPLTAPVPAGTDTRAVLEEWAVEGVEALLAEGLAVQV